MTHAANIRHRVIYALMLEACFWCITRPTKRGLSLVRYGYRAMEEGQ